MNGPVERPQGSTAASVTAASTKPPASHHSTTRSRCVMGRGRRSRDWRTSPSVRSIGGHLTLFRGQHSAPDRAVLEARPDQDAVEHGTARAPRRGRSHGELDQQPAATAERPPGRGAQPHPGHAAGPRPERDAMAGGQPPAAAAHDQRPGTVADAAVAANPQAHYAAAAGPLAQRRRDRAGPAAVLLVRPPVGAAAGVARELLLIAVFALMKRPWSRA